MSATPEYLRTLRELFWDDFGVPWIQSKDAFLGALTGETMAQVFATHHPAVIERQGTSYSHPPHIPSLVGIRDIQHLDATGLVRHRSTRDLMRYAVANQGIETLACYGDFQPGPHGTNFTGSWAHATATSNCTRWLSTSIR